MYFIAVVKVTDIAAYFVGSALGRHKLVPRLSPGKTIEGLIGGVLAAAGTSVVLARLGGIIVPSGVGGWRLGSGEALVFGVAMAFAGQLGDLAESLIKRDVAQKDSGRAVPGFGGILDLVDSPLLAAPLAWWMLHRAWCAAGAGGGP
jgi:phosphatidate cytidylyltransferase